LSRVAFGREHREVRAENEPDRPADVAVAVVAFFDLERAILRAIDRNFLGRTGTVDVVHQHAWMERNVPDLDGAVIELRRAFAKVERYVHVYRSIPRTKKARLLLVRTLVRFTCGSRASKARRTSDTQPPILPTCKNLRVAAAACQERSDGAEPWLALTLTKDTRRLSTTASRRIEPLSPDWINSISLETNSAE
jgi:hypothetical protein